MTFPDGTIRAKGCFSYTDRKLRAKDTYADGSSGRAELKWSAGSRAVTDSNGANNGWEATSAIGLSGANTVHLRTCIIDLDMQNGAGYYCTKTWLAIARPSGA